MLTEEGGYIWNNDELFEINTEMQVLEKISLPEISSVTAEISDFLLSITNEREPLTSGEFALEVYRVIEQV